MKIYDLCGNDGLVGGIYRCYAAGGGNFIADRSSWRSNGGGALALYAQVWRLKGVSYADGFAAPAAAAVAIAARTK